MNNVLEAVSIDGFKSFRKITKFPLNKLNILVGANGAGKSNFVEIFRILREMMNHTFGEYVERCGGAANIVYNGAKTTRYINIRIHFKTHEYNLMLELQSDNSFLITKEQVGYKTNPISDRLTWQILGENIKESTLNRYREKKRIMGGRNWGSVVHDALSHFAIYQFQDAGMYSPMRRSSDYSDNIRLRSDGRNLASMLLVLQNNKISGHYDRICENIRLILPYFEDFILTSSLGDGIDRVRLDWMQQNGGVVMQPTHFSDGTIRFIALITALLQPNLPAVMVIDEPEIGLHAKALNIFADLIKEVSKKTQIIISTQSPMLINYFSSENIIVANHEDNGSTLSQMDAKDMDFWINDH